MADQDKPDHDNRGRGNGGLEIYQSTQIEQDQARPLPPEPEIVTAYQSTDLSIDPVKPLDAPEPVRSSDDDDANKPPVFTPVTPVNITPIVDPPADPTPPTPITPVDTTPLPPPAVDPQPGPQQPTPAPVPTPGPVNAPTPAPKPDPTPKPQDPPKKPTVGDKPPAPHVGAKPPTHQVDHKPPVKKPEKPAPKLGHSYNITSLADPHVTAANGRHFDNSKVGQFVLAESTSGDLKVEAKNGRLPGDAGVWQTDGAVQAGKNVIKYDAASNVIDLNGKKIPFKPGETIKLPGGGSITTSNDVINGQPLHRVQVHTDKGDTVSFLNFPHHGGGRYLDVAVNVSAKRHVGEISGIGGVVGKNELATRDGHKTNDVGKVIDSWRVNKSDNLFASSGGVSRLHQAAGVTPQHQAPVHLASHQAKPAAASHAAAPQPKPQAHVAAPAHVAPKPAAPAKPAPRTPTAPLHNPLHRH